MFLIFVSANRQHDLIRTYHYSITLCIFLSVGTIQGSLNTLNTSTKTVRFSEIVEESTFDTFSGASEEEAMRREQCAWVHQHVAQNLARLTEKCKEELKKKVEAEKAMRSKNRWTDSPIGLLQVPTPHRVFTMCSC